jgi:RNA polymerase sigma-70 factor (ECF subfamily)
VIAIGETAPDELLAAARAGDEYAFQALLAPHLRALHLHCYRMLGSYTEAEDAMQDSLLRAWRGLAGFEERAPLRHWLYRITTTTCLKAIERRGRNPETVEGVAWLQPYPDARLDELADSDADPAVAVDRREGVALAFIAALQLLPATQRAVLILREVLQWPSRDVAQLLDTTVAGVNSALQRARATLSQTPTVEGLSRPVDARQRQLVDAFVEAWRRGDIPALAALLRDDVVLAMPPQAIRIDGRERVIEFFATVPADGRLDLIRLVLTSANGQPTLAAYLPDRSGECRGYGIMVLTVQLDGIAAITGFPDPTLFDRFGLPPTLSEDAAG